MRVKQKAREEAAALLHIINILTLVTLSSTKDVLLPGDSLTQTQTLISPTGIFEFGFFSLSQTSSSSSSSSSSHKPYVGIWYRNIPPITPVWIANRNSPLPQNSTPSLLLSPSGILKLLSPPSPPLFISSPSSNPLTPTTLALLLLDSGNLILTNTTRPPFFLSWQSFHHLTNTWLPGSPLSSLNSPSYKSVLTSWTSPLNPADGDYSFGMDREKEYMTMWWRGKRGYWNSMQGAADDYEFDPRDVFNMSFFSNQEGKYYSYSVGNSSNMMRYVMTPEGRIERMVWDATEVRWVSFWRQPVEECDVFAACGGYGVCSRPGGRRNSSSCGCLPGFSTRGGGDGGCERNMSAAVVGGGEEEEGGGGFLRARGVELPAFGRSVEKRGGGGEKGCASACMGSRSCTAYATVGSGVCLEWEGELYNVKEAVNQSGDVTSARPPGADLFIKIGSFHHSNVPLKVYAKWLVTAFAALVIFVILIYLLYRLWRTLMPKGQNLLLFETTNILNVQNNVTVEDEKEENSDKCIQLPMFSLKSVLMATDNFSDTNKLGEGGFGIVYKGRLHNGEEVAVKRLSSGSGQGIREMRTEAVLIAKLQHKNLVSLLGCCLEHGEKILIYEHLENKSLDLFLFNSSKRKMLDWSTRVGIIEGISQGLLYLHKYSRLRIIHRDLKASNILLDSHMNPKISDFGMARIFATTSSESNTDRIVGTYGYMSPEYAMDGVFSVKSDVFSFGILLLEIISGKRNRRTLHEDCQNLVGYAWELWKAERGIEFVESSSSSTTGQRYVHVGLLCVQENPNDRPTMADVVSMLANDLIVLPPPKQPSFSFKRVDSTASGSGFTDSSSKSQNSTPTATTSNSIEFQSCQQCR